jgi:hypothetical protein
MLIRVRAIRRGQYAGLIFEPGDVLELPHDHAGLAHTGPAGEQLGWATPVSMSGPHQGGTHDGAGIAAEHLARPAATAHPADGLWPVGTGAHDEKLKPRGMFNL